MPSRMKRIPIPECQQRAKRPERGVELENLVVMLWVLEYTQSLLKGPQ